MRVASLPVALCLATACGRIGFDPSADDARGDGGGTDTSSGGDAVPPLLECADMHLGSALGPNVASGSTIGARNDVAECGGAGPELTFGWSAPATASYTIDLCASNLTYNTVLSVRDGTCTGTELACNDDACGLGGLQSLVTVSLVEGQGVVIVVDSAVVAAGGMYQLAITQL
jgi:hypothetical protein